MAPPPCCAPDRGREAAYLAESMAFDGTDLDIPKPLTELVGVAGRIVTGGWWPGPTVAVVAARADARSSSASTTDGRTVTIRLSTPQRTLATLVHELAHALAGVGAGHGAAFRRALLDVVGVVTNLDSTDRRRRLHVDALHDAYVAAGLDVGDRHWPAPPEPGAIAL